jgi:hypothetical protein
MASDPLNAVTVDHLRRRLSALGVTVEPDAPCEDLTAALAAAACARDP